jgi:hypothetical protein
MADQQDVKWDPNPVYELGNAWITFGDLLHEQIVRKHSGAIRLNYDAV